MAKPTDDQFEVAIAWLESNEGDGDEQPSCQAVANWIKEQMTERMLRVEARRGGVRVADLRARLKRKEGN